MASVTMTVPMNDDTFEEGMSEHQVDLLFSKMKTLFLSHRREIPKVVAQNGLDVDNLAMKMFESFRDIAEVSGNLIVRFIKVDRLRGAQKAIHDTGRVPTIDYKVVCTMPTVVDELVELVYFRPDPSMFQNGMLPAASLALEYKKRGLVPDPRAQIDDNLAQPTFADDKPNVCLWQDEYGNYFFVVFNQAYGRRRVVVGRNDSNWDCHWWIAGVRKESVDS